MKEEHLIITKFCPLRIRSFWRPVWETSATQLPLVSTNTQPLMNRSTSSATKVSYTVSPSNLLFFSCIGKLSPKSHIFYLQVSYPQFYTLGLCLVCLKGSSSLTFAVKVRLPTVLIGRLKLALSISQTRKSFLKHMRGIALGRKNATLT